MGLFKKSANQSESNDVSADEILRKQKSGELSAEEFLKQFANIKVFQSSPLGDHKDGSTKLFVVGNPDGNMYHPVFTTEERMRESFEEAGRADYLYIHEPFLSVLECEQSINKGSEHKLGIIIDPGYFGITIDAQYIDGAIDLIKKW